MSPVERKTNWPVVVGVGVVALALGFGAARWSAPGAPASPPDTKAEASAETSSSTVTIPDAYVRSANIAVEPVVAGNVGAELLAPGSVVTEPGSEAAVVSRAAGNVTRVERVLGEQVKAGDVLARVASEDGARMAADLRTAQARAVLARKAQARDADLFRQGVIARQEAEASEAAFTAAQAEADRARTVANAAHVEGSGDIAIVSPIDGTITAADVNLGAYVAPQTAMYRIAASRGKRIEASVRAADTSRVKAGDTATIVRADGRVIPATVRGVTPTVDGITRAATVIVTPTAGGEGLVIGDGVQVRLVAHAGGGESLTVPEEAVQNLDGNDAVFVRTKEGFRAQPVRIGTRSGGMAEILSGVKAGDQVATRNAFLVKAELNKGGGDDEE
ncbi:efflux RND transporter periplasmic adaptor subunit [Luteibacter aegosomatissinici]|uniref:efflux RND transporter periplasmic adaptor subunit n=1 Tax=Luteibacter aegosomatissinici TaxID=2911539 RepID=UPI001FF8DFF0|nr:efflux RND transporter periplasmic adaptor subunit [Luteibacter aegosomatissinici]UPG94298.1 efflux RND transporter periplasmic adaptor subunit [Luteibacter aegosomatissinici]